MGYLLAVVSGALLPLSFAPFSIWPLGLVAAGLWFYVLDRKVDNVLLAGWLFGLGKYGVGVSWVYVSINVYGNAPAPLAAFLVALFVATLALFPMLQAWLYHRLRREDGLSNAWLFALVWVGIEWLLTWFLTGFPWLHVGYAHLDTALGNLAPMGGVLLVSLAAVASATFLVSAVSHEKKGRAITLALLPWVLGFAAGIPAWVGPDEARRYALVQGNIDQAEKWVPENRGKIVDRYVSLSRDHWDVDLMVWPEAAIPVFQHQAGSILENLHARGRTRETALILGIPGVERKADGRIVFKNQAIGIGQASGTYSKQRLVPFGEYVPLEGVLRGLIEFFDLPMSRAESGPAGQALLQAGGLGAAMAICYEVVYPELVREQAVRADVLLTISNDTWFGDSIGPLQHLEMARMRALENGRWLLRSTNNGVTAAVDHLGRVRDVLPQFSQGVLRGEFSTMRGQTPYSRFGHLLLGVIVLLSGFVFFWLWRRNRTATG